MIHLRPLQRADHAAVLRFEIANKAFFEAWVPPRPAGFFDPDGFEQRLAALIADPTVYPFGIWARGQLVGRVNLNAQGAVAELGYRVAEAAQGRGVARQAVAQALIWAGDHFARVEAEARRSNPASERVLEASGFVRTGAMRRFVRPDGETVTLYRWAIDLHAS